MGAKTPHPPTFCLLLKNTPQIVALRLLRLYGTHKLETTAFDSYGPVSTPDHIDSPGMHLQMYHMSFGSC